MLRVLNPRTGATLAHSCREATSLVRRTVGLLDRASLDEGEGLLIRPCSSVHCFLMRFPIDVIFLNEDGRVLKLYSPLRPWRASSIVRGAKQTLELPAGTVARTGTQVGDVLRLERQDAP